jgi:(p)ppGpp synthase/HD superfamily hydrolase
MTGEIPGDKAGGWCRLADATSFALEIHSGLTRRRTDIPCISHLYEVASLMLEHGGSEDAAIAALLHDAVEDQGAHQIDIIRSKFGDAAANIVHGFSGVVSQLNSLAGGL